jgi:hypothetical protein
MRNQEVMFDRVDFEQSARPSSQDSSARESQKPKVVEIRKTFPETWMFDTFEFNST